MVCCHLMLRYGVTGAMMSIPVTSFQLKTALFPGQKHKLPLLLYSLLPDNFIIGILQIVRCIILHIAPFSVYFYSSLFISLLCPCSIVLIPTALLASYAIQYLLNILARATHSKIEKQIYHLLYSNLRKGPSPRTQDSHTTSRIIYHHALYQRAYRRCG